MSIYDIIGGNPDRARRFANSMKVFVDRPEYDASYVRLCPKAFELASRSLILLQIVDHYDWALLGEVHVVDVGGAQGHISAKLARRYDNLNIIVQDMEKVIDGARVPQDLIGRLRFSAHDLFAPQPVPGDVFIFRWILHNWADAYCVKILRVGVPVQ